MLPRRDQRRNQSVNMSTVVDLAVRLIEKDPGEGRTLWDEPTVTTSRVH